MSPSQHHGPATSPRDGSPAARRAMVFELCAETLEACLAAAPGGAARIELCRDLDVGGLTPEPDLVAAAVQRSGVPVHVLLRPAAGSFCTTPAMFAAIAASLRTAKELGAAGVVLGLVRADNTVDLEHTRALVELAAPLPVTFHRAFDETPDLAAALEDVIASGCRRVLTSGGAGDVLSGATALAQLVRQGGDRIEIAAGGGLRLENAARVAELSGCRSYHASLREPEDLSGGETAPPLADRVRELIRRLSGKPSASSRG